MTWLDLCTKCLIEVGELGQGETPSPEDAQWIFGIIADVLDYWSTQRPLFYFVPIATYTLLANVKDYTLGPSGTLVGPRPILVQDANVFIPGTSIRKALNLLDSKKWMSLSSLSSTDLIPQDLYVDGSNTNSGLHFSPTPNNGCTLEIAYWAPFAAPVNLTDTISFPPGYNEPLLYSVCVRISPSYNKGLNPTIANLLGGALEAIKTANAQVLQGALGESRLLNAPSQGIPVAAAGAPAQGGQ